MVIFVDGGTMRFPNDEVDEIGIDTNLAQAIGRQNTAISGKNIISPGSKISVNGDFHLGDG